MHWLSHHRFALTVSLVALLAGVGLAETAGVGSFESDGVWKFGKGSEYPGAQGEFTLVSPGHGGQKAGSIRGDFTGGGRYVMITRKLDPANVTKASLWVKTGGNVSFVLLRLVDETGETHQHRLNLNATDEWQEITLGKLRSGQNWGGDGDKQFTGKLKDMSLLLEKPSISSEQPVATILIDDITLTTDPNAPAAKPSAPAEQSAASTTAASTGAAAWTGTFESGDEGMTFSPGGEYKGAKGSLQRVQDMAHGGEAAMRLSGDFTGGGRYVAAYKKLTPPQPIEQVSLWVRNNGADFILVRVREASGETHQHKVNLKPTIAWQQVTLEKLASPQHWGGDGDGRGLWNGPMTDLGILLERPALDQQKLAGDITFDDVVLHGAGTAEAEPANSFVVPLGNFEDSMDAWWPLHHSAVKVDMGLDATAAAEGDSSLKVALDFSKGNWATLVKQFNQPAQIDEISFRAKSENLTALSVQCMTTEGQRFNKKVKLSPGEWTQVTVAVPTGQENISIRDHEMYKSPVVIRLGTGPGDLADASTKTATLWLDAMQARTTAKGVLYVPGTSIRSEADMTGRIDLPRSIPLYWGADDRPTSVAVQFTNHSDKPVDAPAVALLDHQLRPVATLLAAGEAIAPGKTFTKTLPVNLPEFGHYTVATIVGDKPLQASLAWIAAEGKPDPAGPFGLQTHLAQGPWGRNQSLGGARGTLELIARIGAGWVRDDLHGKFDKNNRLLPPVPGFYNWPKVAREVGLSTLAPYFDYLDNGRPPHSDAGRKKYAERYAQLVEYYSPYISAFEIWNEPNISPGWRGDPNVADYTAMLKEAYFAIKTTSPNATIVAPTSAGTDFRFIEQLLKRDGGKYMDALSAHPYHGVAPEKANIRPDAPPTWMGTGDYVTFAQRMETLHKMLERYDAADVNVWATEMGWPNFDPADEWMQTCWLVRQYLLGMRLPYLVRQFTYNFQDQGYNENEAAGMTFGLMRENAMPEPRLVAYNTMVRMLYRKAFARNVDLGEGVFACEFTGEGQPVLTVWTVDEGRTVTVETASRSVNITGLMGRQRQVQTVGGVVSLGATGEPLFLSGYTKLAAAKPLLSVETRTRLTNEEQLVVTVTPEAGLKDVAWDGVAPQGWQRTRANGASVTFEPTEAATSGTYTFVVIGNGQTAAVSAELIASVVMDTHPAAGGVEVAFDNPFPSQRELKLKAAVDGQPGPSKDVTLKASGTSSVLIPVETELADGWRTSLVRINPGLTDGRRGYMELADDRADTLYAGVTPLYKVPSANVDGQLDEWTSLKPCLLQWKEQAVKLGHSAIWNGPGDLSARFHVGSAADRMVLAVAVRDNAHVQPFAPDALWKGDCVQFAVGNGGKRYEFSVAVDDSGNVKAYQSSPQKRELAAPVELAGRRTEDGYTMEISLPWSTFGASEETAEQLRFALLVNDNDRLNKRSATAGRKGYIQWFDGIGMKKDPSRYGPLKPVAP